MLTTSINWGPEWKATDENAPDCMANIGRWIRVGQHQSSTLFRVVEYSYQAIRVVYGQKGNRNQGEKHNSHLPNIRVDHSLQATLQYKSFKCLSF